MGSPVAHEGAAGMPELPIDGRPRTDVCVVRSISITAQLKKQGSHCHGNVGTRESRHARKAIAPASRGVGQLS